MLYAVEGKYCPLQDAALLGEVKVLRYNPEGLSLLC